jgi:glycosyltransferase involved in cell wall biosynthesis
MALADGGRTWHIVSGEYPPEVGGVSDYTANVARALADAGDDVHVWTSGSSGTTAGRITLHRVFGAFSGRDLARGGDLLDACRDRGRLLIQWVPHAFGRHGINLRFPLWLHGHSVRRHDPIDVMLHEPFMPFGGSLARDTAAAAQRLMTATVLRAATRVFVGTPAWIEKCRPLASDIRFHWMPIPAGFAVPAHDGNAADFRRELNVPADASLIGCFGRGAFQESVLDELGRSVLTSREDVRVLLIGLGSDATLTRLLERRPVLARVMHATGATDHEKVSTALRACDLMVQPYLAGICARHSAAAAVLAHGRPIVTNSGPFTESIWADSESVTLTSSSEPAAFAAAAFRLLDDRAERGRLSKAARQLYDERFDVRHTVSALRS